jgi:xanthine dehydrogenase YagS FAD-binding subunit
VTNFTFASAPDIDGALQARAQPGSAFLAGGTNLVDLWKLGAFPATHLVDLNALPLRDLSATPSNLKFGALVRMSDAASHPDVMKNFPVVSQALLLSASPQLRNMASLGGNLLQRPRSLEYRNPDPKRRDGPSRFDAIFGVTPFTAGVHPSDFAVALLALDATVRLRGPAGERVVKLDDFYKLPDEKLNFTTLQPGELITAIEVANLPFAARSVYVKIRDRASFQFAVVSAAVVLETEGPLIKQARVTAGGVATRPWRLTAVENALQGKPNLEETFQSAVASIGNGAVTHEQNAFKVELLKRTVVRALHQVKDLT